MGLSYALLVFMMFYMISVIARVNTNGQRLPLCLSPFCVDKLVGVQNPDPPET